MDAKYKKLKEDFVSNLSGGSVMEMNLVTLVAPSAVLLWSVLQSQRRAFTPYTIEACLTDCLLNCGAILFVTTIYSNYPLALNLLLIVPALIFYLAPRKRSPEKARPPTSKPVGTSERKLDPLPIRPFVTTYRGTMLAITCAAILAVDFKVFPRRFAKVENWGTSLMDMGVGSFVFTGGLVAARPTLREQTSGRRSSLLQRLRASLWHSMPLLILGVIRLLSTKGLDYAEHVTEYGVHWNFFFTLGLLPPFMAVFHSFFRLVPSYALLAVIVASGYQIVLDSTDLTEYILTAPRTDLFSQNREGFFSFLGYLSIFLSGHATGMSILPRTVNLPATTSFIRRITTSTIGQLLLSSVLWTTLFAISTSYRYGAGLQVSRRLANLPYFLWVSAFNVSQLSLFCAIERLCFPDVHKATDADTEKRRAREATSTVLWAFNRNGLAVFLLANLLTGLVNFLVPTLHVSDMLAMAVLCIYMAVLSGVALTLDASNVSIRV